MEAYDFATFVSIKALNNFIKHIPFKIYHQQLPLVGVAICIASN